MSESADRAGRTDYELIDAGDGMRLERFGPRVVARPAAAALDARGAPDAWEAADLRFESGSGWTGQTDAWSMDVLGLTIELRPTASGGVGFYPEQQSNVGWLVGQVRSHGHDRQSAVLNLFAHTGLASLAAAQAGASVAHVDAARSAVAWARRNAELSGLADRSIRWLVDDAAAFVDREARRGRRYDGIVLDPPSFGRAGTRRWRLVDELPGLLAACRPIATDHAFVLLTAHTTGVTGEDLCDQLRATFGSPPPGRALRDIEVLPLVIEATSGARLELGSAARLAR